MTNSVKQRSLLKAWTLETVDAAAPIKFAPWSRAAPVKLWTRCNKLSRDFAGLDGADVPEKRNQLTEKSESTIKLPRAGPFPKLKDKSPDDDGGAEPGAENWDQELKHLKTFMARLSSVTK